MINHFDTEAKSFLENYVIFLETNKYTMDWNVLCESDTNM